MSSDGFFNGDSQYSTSSAALSLALRDMAGAPAAVGGDSGEEAELGDGRKRKRSYRHTPYQIEQLEAAFKEYAHPDEKQRAELSQRLCLERQQIKFWFQNRRTQVKTQMERQENLILRTENAKLRAENLSIRELMRNPTCEACGSPAILGGSSAKEQSLRIENACLKDELDRLCSLARKFASKPIPGLPNSTASGLTIGNKALGVHSGTNSTNVAPVSDMSSLDRSRGRLMFLELALAAAVELVKMAQFGEPLWARGLDGREMLDYEEYRRCFPGSKPSRFASEASRSTEVVAVASSVLIDTLMDATKWAEMFHTIVARVSTAEVISEGLQETRNGALQIMEAELQVLSPLVPVREVNFLRFCRQIAEGSWAIVDVSIDGTNEQILPSNVKCRRLPSGCLVQSMPDGYSKVTWVEHSECDETAVHPLYRTLFRSGLALGAFRWIATLQRQCQSLAIVHPQPSNDTATVTQAGRRSMLKLARRMTDNFCMGVCPSSAREWRKLDATMEVGEGVRIMTRQSVVDPGEPLGVVMCAATSVWLPTGPDRVFEFLRNEEVRCQWDILCHGGPMQAMAHIAMGSKDCGNMVSLLQTTDPSANQNSILILQETSTESSGSMIVYAPVDEPAMHLVMAGADSAYVALLPSGFAILPSNHIAPKTKTGADTGPTKLNGSLLTVAFQILVNTQPTAKLTIESVETVNNLISCTIEKIKEGLNCGAYD